MPRLVFALALLAPFVSASPASAVPLSGPADPPRDRAVPELVSGLEALVGAIAYPAVAEASHVQGRVVVQFVVDEGGEVARAAVVTGVHPALDAEALRAVRAARFHPATVDGLPVAVELTLPITFELPGDDVTGAVAPLAPVSLG